VPAHDAVGAAFWTARTYLTCPAWSPARRRTTRSAPRSGPPGPTSRLPGLEPRAPADAVGYAEDPRTDLDQLGHPLAVILRGRRIR
jgi:hypothetical protein